MDVITASCQNVNPAERKLQAIDRRQQIQQLQTRAELIKLRTMQVSVADPSKTVRLAPIVSTKFLVSMSVASFVSVRGEGYRDTPPTTPEATVSGSFGNAEKRDLSSKEAQKSKSERLEFDRLSIGPNCSIDGQKRQQLSSSPLKKQQLTLGNESKRIKRQLEQYQRQNREELRQFPEKMQILELENDLNRTGSAFIKGNL